MRDPDERRADEAQALGKKLGVDPQRVERALSEVHRERHEARQDELAAGLAKRLDVPAQAATGPLRARGRADAIPVELRRDGDRGVALSVADGPGVAADQRTRVLEPFERGAAAGVPGSGLGLAVVAQQAALHAGAVALDHAELGGLRATVRLPLVSRPAS